jgi:hypothetical protein
MRLFSALCVLGAGLLVRRALEREGPGPAAAWALPVFVLMPLGLYYAAEARAYALVLLLAAALLEGMAARRHPLWLGALAAGLLLTHSLSVLLLPFLLAAPLLFGDRRLWWVPILGVLAWLPFLPVLLGQPRDSIAWMQAPVSGVQAVRFLAGLAPPGPAFDLFPFPWGMALPATLTGVTALIAGLALATPGLARAGAAGFLLTSGALFAVSLGWMNVYHPSRGEVLAWPFLAVGGLSMLHRRLKPLFVHLLMGAVTLFLAVQAFVWVRGLPDGLPWEAIARGVRTHVRNGDRILVPGPWALTLDHYLKKGGSAVTVETIPTDQASHPGWYRCTALPIRERDTLARAADGARGGLWLFRDRTQPCAGQAAEALRPRPVEAFGPFLLERVEPPDPSGTPAQGPSGAGEAPAPR